MNRKLVFAFVLGGLALIQAGCTTFSYTSRSTRVNQNEIRTSEQVADVTVNYQKKITATSDFQKLPNQAKQQAIYQCIMNNNVDVIVDPIFQVENRPVTGYRATVTGFAGYLKEGKKDIDVMIEKGYQKEDIEKYLLLSDPSFYQYYYQKGDKGSVYNIKCGAAAPAPQAAPVLNLNLNWNASGTSTRRSTTQHGTPLRKRSACTRRGTRQRISRPSSTSISRVIPRP